ncbi:MAG TPA: universal stress protein [Candidatus Competibacteraceae bacterium]|nr:universal stress protein [Candidatus Competibacteraceae bacterium]
MLKNILVATDASPASNRAVEMAADLAGRYQTPLYILHVIRDMDLPPELRKMAEVERIFGPRADVLRFVANKILDEARTRAQTAGAREIHTLMGEGDPASTIIRTAEENQVELIVLGTRGLGEVKSMLLGSVSRKVSNLAGISTLIVK